MFRILEIKQQIFPMERISSHTSPLHLRQELSLKWAHVNATDARCFATKPRQLPAPPPLLIPGGVRVFLFFAVLVGKPLGFVDTFSFRSAASSEPWRHTCVGTAAACADGAFGNKVARSLQSSPAAGLMPPPCTWTNIINN